LGLEARADGVEPDLAHVPVGPGRADLDQLVRLQRPVDLRDHLVGEALVADEDDRIEAMRLAAQLAAPLG